jgi:RHS repeat-associated protein
MTYGYDIASRLTSIAYAKGSTTVGDLGYAYDAAGQRIGVTGAFARTNFPTALTSATYNADNELTNWGSTSPTYDANGSMLSDGTNSYTWDARNQLSTLTKGRTTNSFQYDAYGRRTQKTVGGATTSFLYDGANPVQELSGATPTANLLTGLGVDQFLTRTDAAGTRDFLPDALGSTVALTDSTGVVQTSYTYEPFGNATAAGSTSTNSYQFTGRENDATGLDFFRARYYNPTLQRFVSQDPVGFGGGDLNLYGYTGQSPNNFSDPNGEIVPILASMAVGCLVGASVAGLIDDIKLANAARKGRQSDVDFAKYGKDLIGGCVAGAVFAGVAAVAGMVGEWALGGVLDFVAPNAAKVLMPGGALIGDGGASAGIRVIGGGAFAIGRLFLQLTRGATQIEKPSYGGIMMQLPKGGTVGLRISDKFGPTLDIDIPGFDLVQKIHIKP